MKMDGIASRVARVPICRGMDPAVAEAFPPGPHRRDVVLLALLLGSSVQPSGRA